MQKLKVSLLGLPRHFQEHSAIFICEVELTAIYDKSIREGGSHSFERLDYSILSLNLLEYYLNAVITVEPIPFW